jgi:hypothetical protein
MALLAAALIQRYQVQIAVFIPVIKRSQRL